LHIQINLRAGRTGQFARQHADGAADHRFLGVRQRAALNRRRTTGEDTQVQRVKIGLGQRLRQPCQAPEPLFDVAVKRAGPRARRRHIVSQPEMRDAVRQPVRLFQRCQQLVVATAPLFPTSAVWRPGR